MTAAAASLSTPRARTGGPRDDGPELVERVLGWVLVVAVAVLVTRLGLL
ncbi:SCO1431 family membrane protein [Streptomyces sp. CC228A]|nr:SCO1431 family membrane protein [Streptomyces sp. CC228A]